MTPSGETPVSLTVKPPGRGRLSFREALVSPCLKCEESPCCTHLPLGPVPMHTLLDVDNARYLLGFDGIELGLNDGGWSAYYTRACRELTEDGRCGVHATPAQPSVCVHYSPYSCWYRGALADGADHHLRLDRRRFELLVDGMAFDDNRLVAELPEWDDILSMCAAVPLETVPPPPVETDPVLEGWIAEVVAEPKGPAGRHLLPVQSAEAPCGGCSAPCCSTLVFPAEAPATEAALDFFRFALGFPGVEIGISDGGWATVIRTRCRHLRSGRCSVYGSDERPLRCQYLDALRCSYRVPFGTSRPPGFLRIDHRTLAFLGAALERDETGAIAPPPPTEDLRERVEVLLRHEAAAVH